MHTDVAEQVLSAPERVLPRQEVRRPDIKYIKGLFATYGVELDSLPGLNAMTRPHTEQQRTIGEIYYGFDSPAEVMEFNRTVMNVWLYDLVSGEKTPEELQAAYESFVHSQKKDILTFEDFITLKHIVDTAIPPEMSKLFRAMLIYSDLGKSTRMQDYMRRHYGREYADHDKLVLDVLKDEAAIEHCMPSFLKHFDENEQAIMKACFESGFHLGQYQKFETLPVHLMKIQALLPQLRDMIMLTGLFDIAGTLGDKVQDGTPVLTHSTFAAFLQARDSVQAVHPDAGGGVVDAAEQALYSYELYLESRNEAFGFDLNTPKGRALTRFTGMFRVMTEEEIQGLSKVFDNKLNEATQQLFIELLDMTGFEKDAFWVEYGPAFARNLYKAMRASGCSYEVAMATAMTSMARLCNSIRRELDKHETTDEPATIMVAELAHAAQGDGWSRIVKNNIKLSPAANNPGEYTAHLEPVPSIQTTESNTVTNLNYLRNTDGITLAIGVGGGSDCEYARFTAETLIGDKGSPVVSFPGIKSRDVHNAERIADTVWLATLHTSFEGKRSFEGLSAQAGPCYIITDVEKGEDRKLRDAYEIIARHVTEATGQRITQILTVDSGGDIMERSSGVSARWSRDLASLEATKYLEESHGIQRSNTVVLVPGVGAPADLDSIARQAEASVFIMPAELQAAFRAQCERNGLPSSSLKWYSQMIDLGYYACRPDNLFGVWPLNLPLEQVLVNNRPAFGVTTESMRQVVVINNSNLRAYHSL